MSWFNSLRGKPSDTGVDAWREHLQQLESVSLSRRDLTIAFSWSLFNWIADVACLAFAAYAAGGKPSLAGLTVAYAAARAVGSIPLMPGGLLVVEAVLVPGLVSSGMTLASAISAMLIYRLVSWIFIAAIGWVVFFFMFRTEKDVDPDAADRRTADPSNPPPTTRPTTNPIHRRRCMPTSTHAPASQFCSGRSQPARRVGCASSDEQSRRRRRRRTSATLEPRTTRRASRRSGGRDTRAGRAWSPRRCRCPATDGKIHLAYELQLTNVLDQDVTMTSVGARGRPNTAHLGR